MKGTYIKVLNDVVFDELKTLKAEAPAQRDKTDRKSEIRQTEKRLSENLYKMSEGKRRKTLREVFLFCSLFREKLLGI